MKKLFIKLFSKVVFAVTVAVVFASCSTLGTKKTPYVLGADSVLASDNNSYVFAGVDFTFFNATEKTVADFTVVFYVYDSEGEKAFAGSNCVMAKCDGPVGAMNEVQGEISLDEYLTQIPDEPYQIDYLYVSQIKYTDGSTWNDRFGFYAY